MYSWLLPILASALGLGIYDLCRKHAVRENSVVEVLFCSTSTGLLVFTVVAILMGEFTSIFRCTLTQYGLVLAKAVLVGSSWGCVFYAMRTLPISIAAPIRATSPFWTVLGGLVFYHEIPGIGRALGMLLILLGYYCFSAIGAKEGFSFKHRAIHLIVVGTLLGSCSALYDKYLLGILAIPPRTVQFYFALNLVLLYGTVLTLTRIFVPKGKRHTFEWRWTIPLTGLLLILSDFVYFYALSLPDVPISIVSLFRRSSCIITFSVGVFLFREHFVGHKALALVVILAGTAVIALT